MIEGTKANIPKPTLIPHLKLGYLRSPLGNSSNIHAVATIAAAIATIPSAPIASAAILPFKNLPIRINDGVKINIDIPIIADPNNNPIGSFIGLNPGTSIPNIFIPLNILDANVIPIATNGITIGIAKISFHVAFFIHFNAKPTAKEATPIATPIKAIDNACFNVIC